VGDRLLVGQRRARLLRPPPRICAELVTGGCDVVAFESIINRLAVGGGPPDRMAGAQ
jgi:hypothetical protein